MQSKILILMCAVLLGLAACGKGDNAAQSPQTPVAKQLSAADVLTMQAQDFAQVVAFTGSLKPIKEATVSAESGGTLAKLLVDEGNAVQAGQVIAVMDNQAVRESLQGQQAQVQNSQANLDLAATKLKQQQVLFGKGFVSKLALEQAQNEYKVALGNHKAQQAELSKLNKNQADANVRAPISGVVYDKLVNAGELVNAGGQILKIAQTNVLEIAATVSSEQVTFVREGQEVRFTVATGAPRALAWLKELGVRFEPGVYQVYGSLWPRTHSPSEPEGSGYIRPLLFKCRELGVSIRTGTKVLRVIRSLADEHMTMVIVTHEMQFARAIADQVIMLEDGGIVEQSDDAEAFFTNPKTERAKRFLHTFEFDRHRKPAEPTGTSAE